MIIRCLLSCCCALVFGQTKETSEIRCTFRALAWSAPIEDAAYQSGRRSVPLLIPSDFFSAPQAYRGGAELKFGRLASPAKGAQPSASEKAAAAELAIARRADEAYAGFAQEAATLTAGATEGPAGENLRRQAESLMAKAAEQAAAAAAARAKAQLTRSAKPEEAAPQATAPVAAKPRFVPRGQIRLRDGGAYLLLFAEDEQGWRITALEDSPEPCASSISARGRCDCDKADANSRWPPAVRRCSAPRLTSMATPASNYARPTATPSRYAPYGAFRRKTPGAPT